MNANLREHFDEAVSQDPGADPGVLAHAAIARGGHVRRRRRQMAVAGVAAGVVSVLAVVAGVNHESAVTSPASPPAALSPTSPPAALVPQMILVAATDCAAKPVDSDATDVVVFPGDKEGHVTDRMLSDVRSALEEDPRVGPVLFETREQIYQRFKKQWAGSPEFVASVSPDALPEFFRLRLVDASQYVAFRAQYEARVDVMFMDGYLCKASAPIGGIQ
jgi:hypothetical protein